MREVILHLGIPKTGSTALQAFLARNYDALQTQSVEYFRIGEFELGLQGRIAAGNGVDVACGLLPENHRRRIGGGERYIRELECVIAASPAERGLLSSEMFASADRGKLAALVGRLAGKGLRVRAIYYIRRQDKILSSSYVQQVRLHRYSEPPDDYVRRVAANNSILRYHSFHLAMVALFGEENVAARIYEEAIARRNGVFEDFLDAAGIEGDGISFAIPRMNTSVSSREVILLMLLNRFRPRDQLVEMVLENAEKNPGASGGKDVLSRTMRMEIAELFQDENRKLAEEYFLRPRLFAPDPFDGPEDPLAISTLSLQDLAICLGGLVVRLDGRTSENGRIARAAAKARAAAAEVVMAADAKDQWLAT